jgi:predicted neuraminidase
MLLPGGARWRAGELMCTWYRSAGRMTGIVLSRLAPGTRKWSKPQQIVSTQKAGNSLQNPVLYYEPLTDEVWGQIRIQANQPRECIWNFDVCRSFGRKNY